MKCNSPPLKKFWQRLLVVTAIALALGLVDGWILAQVDLQELNQQVFLNKRETMAKLMLNLMSPASWGWFIFGSILVAFLAGDWWCHRFRDLPEEGENEP